MLRTAGLLALPKRALSAGFDGGISPSFQFVAAQLLGGWDLTETGLAPASPLELIWTHLKRGTPLSRDGGVRRSSGFPFLKEERRQKGLVTAARQMSWH